MATLSTSTAAQTHKRRWYQFSLRAVLIFVLVVSIPLSLFARRLDRARRQQAAVAAIWKAGGSVGYDFSRAPEGEKLNYNHYDSPDGVLIGSWDLQGPNWMRDRFGIDFAYQAEEVAFPTIYPITSFPVRNWVLSIDPKWLQVQRTGSDAKLALLKPLSGLREIHTCGPEVTDAGLVHLTGFAHLEYLGLYHTSVTDEGLKHLHSMPQLRHIYLSESKVTTRGVGILRQSLPNCVIEFDEPAAKPAASAPDPAFESQRIGIDPSRSPH